MKGLQCKNCGTKYAPPLQTCRNCGHSEFDDVELSGKGIINTYTVIRVPPTEFSDEAPYTVAVIELEEGVKVTARVNNDPEKIEMGKSVEFVSEDKYRVFELSG